MTPISFHTGDIQLNVTLADSTLKPLLGELQIVSPLLADKVQQAAFDATSNLVQLKGEEVRLLAAAARVVSNSLIDDPEIEQVARLAD